MHQRICRWTNELSEIGCLTRSFLVLIVKVPSNLDDSMIHHLKSLWLQYFTCWGTIYQRSAHNNDALCTFFCTSLAKNMLWKKVNYVLRNWKRGTILMGCQNLHRGLLGQAAPVLLQNSPLYRSEQEMGLWLVKLGFLLPIPLCYQSKDTERETGMLRLENWSGKLFGTDLCCWNTRCVCALCRCF